MVTKGENRGEGGEEEKINQEIGINMYTLLHICFPHQHTWHPYLSLLGASQVVHC